MRIWTISDLHIRGKDAIGLLKPERFPEADVCVVAGDVCDSLHLSVNWVGKVIRPVMPVVYVLGNHEFYDTSIERGRKDAAMIAKAQDVTLLDDGMAVIDGVRFLGGTLWTDFELFAAGDAETRRNMALEAMYKTRHGIADYGNIYWNNTGKDGTMPRMLVPRDTVNMHRKTAEFIDETLAAPFDGPSVVVTHHAPHPGSVHAKFADDPVTPGFVSDLSGMIERWQPDLWIHGHVHQPFDYGVGSTRIVCNPRGYRMGMENPDFDFMKVIEVGKGPSLTP